ncbi:hypothetical protein I302_101830 [Kwoniella bestiolae CBS 10118]|uniref:Uncharacterized protein n=1 Tax=Kwoniella bestiolae CBS 10118 TaxID=1296100 RepID=A0A1B9GDE0_9TREE|nr:hypothetical protein I302_00508 [Kwoniella bestiolae CBS 10118]OCF29017.1 hypothetical protein I302_00508 [Kwoniella bestiolae CBS 10118]
MVSSCSDADPKIEFTDTLIERSGVTRIFLDLINNTTPTTSHQTLGHFRNCISFAHKYSCHTVLWGLDKFSWGFLATPLVISARFIYVLAAELNNVQLAAECIRKVQNQKMPPATNLTIRLPGSIQQRRNIANLTGL